MQLRTSEALSRVTRNIERVIVGKRLEIEYVLVALLCQGHVLIEDVPGVGKTTLVRSLARSLGCDFRRIQFTTDLLPSDVTGVSVFNQKTGEFEFRPGPIMSQIVLADEINRASPKTQSALLECMEEGQLTIDGVTRRMPRPFLVLATQNPIEYEGTFPLPEAQLDRFLLRLRLGYPTLREEMTVVERAKQPPLEELGQVLSAEEVLRLQQVARSVHVDESVLEYMVRIVQATREHRDVYLGASPRGSIALYRTSQAIALIRGREYVTPDDVKEMAPLVLAHRVIMRPEAQLRGTGAENLVAEVLNQVPVPAGVKSYAARQA
ncbi:AAA family ATPase [Symbiobacterium terraclitae]|uniref:AAA family ATPase n=1 Tax=Symbiobacterium terraclitae TaxID=557451 RepID=UPI001AE12B56|nr:MoxR family ATPase [Symbiobacterium terraclitae]